MAIQLKTDLTNGISLDAGYFKITNVSANMVDGNVYFSGALWASADAKNSGKKPVMDKTAQFFCNTKSRSTYYELRTRERDNIPGSPGRCIVCYSADGTVSRILLYFGLSCCFVFFSFWISTSYSEEASAGGKKKSSAPAWHGTTTEDAAAGINTYPGLFGMVYT